MPLRLREMLFQVHVRQFLAYTMKHIACLCVMIRLVIAWREQEMCPALKVDCGVQILTRRSAKVQYTDYDTFIE